MERFIATMHVEKQIHRNTKTMFDDYLLESDGVDCKPIYLIDALVLCGMTDDDNVKVVVTVPGLVSTAFGSESDKINRRLF